MAVTKETAAKEMGVISQWQAELVTVKVRVPQGNLIAGSMRSLAELAERYGTGAVHLTVRQCVEIPHIRRSEIGNVKRELESLGIAFGATGPRVRVITACPGARSCKNGLDDAIGLAQALEERYYAYGPLPHKFKIAVAGCINSCVKPQENDLGFIAAVVPAVRREACTGCGACARVCPARTITLKSGRPYIDHAACERDGACIRACSSGALYAARRGWDMYAGGKIGRRPQLGTRVAGLLSDADAIILSRRVIGWYEKRGANKERLGDVVNRIGINTFIQDMRWNDEREAISSVAN